LWVKSRLADPVGTPQALLMRGGLTGQSSDQGDEAKPPAWDQVLEDEPDQTAAGDLTRIPVRRLASRRG
jgi:hypothetical protein